MPKYEISEQLPKRQQVEAIYLKSQKRVRSFYNIDLMDVSQFPYPYNVLLSNWDANRKMRVKGRYRSLCVTENDGEKSITVSVAETLDTGYDLYYIPVASLYKGLQDKADEWLKLLMGVCVYLYRKAGVCHYRDSESYICYLYDIMDGWIEDDKGSMDDEDYKEQRSNLDEMLAIGEKIEPYLADESYLLLLQDLIQACEPQSKFQQDCLKIAKETLAVWVAYPYANLYQNVAQEDEDEDDYYGTGKVLVTDYISFIGETSGAVYENIKNMLNDDFNERSGTQNFEVNIAFNKEKGSYHDQLGYEEKVIEIINELCCLLTELP
ncbi:hypothetical protein FO440_14355 [Mucilaginibacter corticis]|uniref:Uncharacterized protein n=1 Tax=Mucilaginibacter corticis TaxID=2597670 RepID=A0A556MLX2_9SPHI|nr:hypothetical protein [Mucilaginibacter corticis]TSJ40916.1 hypothetical protein FO440_14355 [Mucilaginibacter corticis]